MYVSRDMGQSWQFSSRQSTDEKEFPFESDQDGEYWFALKTLDRDRKLLPEGDPQIDLKIIVDTVKPKLDFRIETDPAGRIACRWHATDENISPQTLRIFYQPISNDGVPENWKQVPINLSGKARAGIYADQLAWWPDTTQRAINVAVEIKDIAGNTVQLTRQVQVTQAGWRHQQQSTAQVATNDRAQSDSNWTMPQPGQEYPANSEPILPPANQKVVQKINQTQDAHPPNHPPNVVCKDGVCQLVNSPAAPANGSGTRGLADSGPAHGQTESQYEPGPMKLVGSKVELASPPVPNGFDPRQASANAASPSPFRQSRYQAAEDYLASRRPANHSSANTQVWQSETDAWIPKTQSSSSTTMRPDPTLAPVPYTNFDRTPRQSVTNVPSNPQSLKRTASQVIGESSTMGATNQYRGLNSQGGQPIAQSTLLPGVAGVPSGRHQQRSAGGSTYPVPNGFTQPKSLSTVAYRPPTSRGRETDNVMPKRHSNAPIQIIGSKRFRLNYGIDSIDPSGVAGVDLWLTRDDGKTWQAWGTDPDSRSPFPVEVQEEGRYGFRIVVHSKDGLTGQGPSSGDDPDMWILVDTQSPLARITSVPYGRGKEAGRLVINYSVSDKFLTLRPIVLAYSSNPQGPWEIIGEGLRNEGRYVWKPTPKVNDRIFLRIDALDKAGNVGVHVLSQAIDVSGLVPRGTIHGVVPVGQR